MRTNSNEKVYPHPYYPVGSIYLSTNNTNPSTWFGGEWQLIAQGMTLVGVDPNDNDFKTPKKTGGEKTHKLTVNEMPNHDHEYFDRMMIWDADGNNTNVQTKNEWNNTAVRFKGWGTKTMTTGGDQAHNNMPPYFTCYIWNRIA